MGAFVGIGFLLLIMVVFIIGIVIFLAGVISLIIYIAVKRKKKKRIRPIIALPIIAVVIGLVLSSPVLVVTGSNLNSYLKNQAELRDTGVFVEMDDYYSFEFEGKTYIQLAPYLDEIGDVHSPYPLEQCPAVANIVFTEKEEEEKEEYLLTRFISGLGKFFFFTPESVYRLYRPVGLNDNNILYSERNNYNKGIWCAEDYFWEAKLYYNDPNIYDYYLIPESPSDTEKTRIKVDYYYDEDFLWDRSSFEQDSEKLVQIKKEDIDTVQLCFCSEDNVIIKYIESNMAIYNGTVYYVSHIENEIFYCYPTTIELSE